jgi:hypothetical protein
MPQAQTDLHCPLCGHEVFKILEDGFHCARCGHKADPYCKLAEGATAADIQQKSEE